MNFMFKYQSEERAEWIQFRYYKDSEACYFKNPANVIDDDEEIPWQKLAVHISIIFSIHPWM